VPFDLTASPIPVMAYVAPRPQDADRLAALPYRDKTWYLNVGIVTNALTAGVFATATALVDGKWLAALIITGVTVAVWLARRPIAAYVLPALSVPVLAFFVWSLIGYHYSLGHTGFGFAAMAQDTPHVTGLSDTLWFLFAVNLAIAALNSTPVFGDNGKVIHELLLRWTSAKVGRIYEVTAVSAVLVMFAVAILSDLTALAIKIFQ
jgi:hypothetical protein